MNDSSERFTSNQIEAIAEVIGEHLTRTEIVRRLANSDIPTDISMISTKRWYLQETLESWQDTTQSRTCIVKFIEHVMQPVNFISPDTRREITHQALLSQLRAVLKTSGLGLRDDGTVSDELIDMPQSSIASTLQPPLTSLGGAAERVPSSIADSLAKFRNDHPDSAKMGFIMMSFKDTRAHLAIVETIKNTLAASGGTAVRADDKYYNTNLYANIQTYMHGCGFGIAVYERLESNIINPNVSFEVGYMWGLDKRVCLLKDRTIDSLQTDLTGSLYVPFDTQDIDATLRPQLDKWLRSFGIA